MAHKKIKRVVTTKDKSDSRTETSHRYTRQKPQREPVEFLFQKKNFIIAGVGLVLMLIGFILMTGGSMPSPDIWDDSIIYSKRIVVVSPVFILSGLAVVAYSIFKR